MSHKILFKQKAQTKTFNFQKQITQKALQDLITLINNNLMLFTYTLYKYNIVIYDYLYISSQVCTFRLTFF